MTTNEWAAVVGVIISLAAAVYGAVRVMVSAIMREFSPNGGSSLKDQVNRIEDRLEWLVQKMID
jgi:hypothetical protein